jgi:hypothetical protein
MRLHCLDDEHKAATGGRASVELSTMNTNAATNRPQPKITVSQQTTYITEPLRADGYVDYVAAVNSHCFQGVTPENNAAIPFCRALGPKGIDKKIRKRFFDLIGAPELPEEGAYLVAFYGFVPQSDEFKRSVGRFPEDPAVLEEEATSQLDRVQRAPWSAAEYPAVAALLEKNKQPLQLVVEGTQRPRLYSPAVPIEGESLSQCCLLPLTGELREAVRQLRARAMLRLGHGQVSDAWQDALACHRLARLAGEGVLVVDALVAASYESMASLCTVALAQNVDVTCEQAGQWQYDLRKLPAKRPMRQYWDFGERLWALANIADMALHGWPDPPEIDLGEPLAKEIREIVGQSEVQVKARRLFSDDPRIDWDEVLQYYNDRYDQVVSALGEPTPGRRHEALGRFIGDTETLYEQAMKEASNRDSLPAGITPKAIARQFGDLLWQGTFGTAQATLNAALQSDVCAICAALALGLAAYRHDHGGYPRMLADLSPKYIAEIPKDPFADGDLHYKPEGDGYLLYSVGPNGKDDGGRSFRDEDYPWSEDESPTEQQWWDDIAIRTPAKMSEKK